MGVFEKSQERSGNKNHKTSDFVSSNLPNKILIFKSLQVVKKLFISFEVRLRLQSFFRVSQNYLILNAFKTMFD